MSNWPTEIRSVNELDELLSRPAPRLIELMRSLSGDIMILGAGGKIGPTMTALAKRAVDTAGVRKRIVAVDVAPLKQLEPYGIETITCDLLDIDAVARLPDVENIVYMVGRKFGSTGSESLTWAINVIVAGNIARRFTSCRIAAFSTGCVYPVMDIRTGGATEETPPEPVGEYAMSCLGRERMFDFYSERKGERVVHIRLNYAVESRYGVLCDIATKVWAGEPLDVTTGFANAIWQGDACNQVLQALALASSPATILNVTGPETFSIRDVAMRMGKIMGKKPVIIGQENGRGYISNATRANALFGNPSVPLGVLIEWTARWIMNGGPTLGKPTHFETQDGKF